MIDLAMVWRREDPKQAGLAAIADGVKYYKDKYGALPNFVNIPRGFLTEAEIAQLRGRWTVATNAPVFLKDEIWLGVKTMAGSGDPTGRGQLGATGRGQETHAQHAPKQPRPTYKQGA
jgi:hypothetical protein